MSRILILVAGHLCNAPRPLKEAETLAAAGHEVTVRGLWFDSELADRDRDLTLNRRFGFEPIQDLRAGSFANRSRNFAARARRRLAHEAQVRFGKFSPAVLGYDVNAVLKAALSERADLTIVHSEAGLWVGSELLKQGMRVGVDFEDWFSEDLLPQDRVGRPIKQLKDYEAELMRQANYRVTTSHALAEALGQAYAAPAPAVVYNVFPFADRDQIDGEIKDRSDTRVPSLHWFSQNIGEGRGLETLFQSLPLISIPLEVHLRGNCSESTRAWIDRALPDAWRERVFIHPTVANSELLSRIAEHDVGLALETPEIKSRNLTITNKLFQYLQAGLAVVATDTLGQSEVFQRRPQIGSMVPASNPPALARAIEELLKDSAKLSAAKGAALKAAEEEFCWEKQQSKLVAAVAAALERQTAEAKSANLRFATVS